MLAFVYKSLKKVDTYVYLASRDAFDCLPEPLRAQLGGLQSLEVALTPERRLARGNVDVVRNNLPLALMQFPPSMADPMSEDWGTDA